MCTHAIDQLKRKFDFGGREAFRVHETLELGRLHSPGTDDSLDTELINLGVKLSLRLTRLRPSRWLTLATLLYDLVENQTLGTTHSVLCGGRMTDSAVDRYVRRRATEMRLAALDADTYVKGLGFQSLEGSLMFARLIACNKAGNKNLLMWVFSALE